MSRYVKGRKRLALGFLAVLAAVAMAVVLFACTQTPTPVPVRTFERAQKVDFVCLRMTKDLPDGTRQVIRPEGRPVNECTPTPADEDGASFTNQLFALVTQTTRGEVAVVNLTSGIIIDVSAKTPSANFLPVGANPTDIASAPDGQMTFVASAEPNKAAIYALPSERILGDKAAVRSYDAAGNAIDVPLPPDPLGLPTLASWPVCALEQAPAALSIVPRAITPGSGDPGYEVVAVLPGDRLTRAKVVTIDPKPFLRGAGLLPADAGAVVAPGSLAPCVVTSAVELAGEDLVPPAFQKGPTWPNGVPYADAGALDLTCEVPAHSARCGLPPCCATTTDGGAVDAGACARPEGDAGTIPLDVGPLEAPRVVAIARDEQTIYVADEAVPFVHVLDVSTPGAIRERAPLLATSLTDPSRPVGVRALAVSPPTRDYEKFLYAVDARTGSLMVFDVSAPSDVVRTPLTRPFPELNPFQSPDRVAFNSPVVAVEFARADVPVTRAPEDVTGLTGALCNPNPNADPNDPGILYRANSAAPSAAFGAFGPRRLRGVFAFVTLANGTVAVVDVDDWDAPCRRPARLTGAGPTFVPPQGETEPAYSSIARGQTATGTDPYSAPIAAADSTSDEAYFPVSLPHRLRSAVFLRASTTTGKQIPYVSTAPVVERRGVQLATAGNGSEATPILEPTIERPAEAATGPGVRFSFEVPDVHIDQDWSITYEGALPGFEGYSGALATEDGFESLVVRQPGARFCAKGVEDWDLGRERAAAVVSALQSAGRRPPAEAIDRRMADYVQITSDLLGPDDDYWKIGSSTEAGSCWKDIEAAPGRARYDLCNATFGAPGDESPGRDFPILEAYDDKLVLGRFFNFQTTPNATREVVYKHPTNARSLALAQCCFHGQAKFTVRGGGQWVTVGSSYGFLSHLVPGAGGRCEPSCDPREALLNARAPGVPRAATGDAPAISRDSVLALRNPVFSFFVENGIAVVPDDNGGSRVVDAPPLRDTQWRFTTRGQFQSLSVAIGGQSTSVSPQSMRFIPPLGQVAVVDAASQGLVIVDLRTVSIARSPFF